MHKNFFFILCFFFFSLFSVNETKTTFSKIKEKGELVVAMYHKDRIPFFYLDKNGKLKGLDISIIETIAKSIGVPFKILRVPTFNAVVEAVSSGKADMGVSKLSFTIARGQKVLYTDAYTMFRKGLLVNRIQLEKMKMDEGKPIIELFNNNKVKIGVIANSSYEQYAHKLFPKAQIISSDDWKNIVSQVYQGDLVAAFRDEFELANTIFWKPDGYLKLFAISLKNENDPIKIIVPANQPHMINWLNNLLKESHFQEKLESILKLYYQALDEMKAP